MGERGFGNRGLGGGVVPGENLYDILAMELS